MGPKLSSLGILLSQGPGVALLCPCGVIQATRAAAPRAAVATQAGWCPEFVWQLALNSWAQGTPVQPFEKARRGVMMFGERF